MLSRNHYIYFIILFVNQTISFSQQIKYWSLEDCISYGLEKNINIKEEKLNIDDRKLDLFDAKLNFAPSLSLLNSYNISTGRVLDPTIYNFIENETVTGNSTSLSMDLPLTDNLMHAHMLKRAKLNLKNALLKLEELRFDTKLNITAVYLETLCAKENIKKAEGTLDLLKEQAQKTSKRLENGKVTKTVLLQIQSQIAEAENELLAAINSYKVSKLSLCHLLEIDNYNLFELAEPHLLNIDSMGTFLSKESISEIAEFQPTILITKTNMDIARKNIQIAKTEYIPSISLSFGYGSSYSNAREKSYLMENGDYGYAFYPFREQYKNNASSYISLNFTFPLLNKLSVKKEIQRQKNELKRNEYRLQTSRKVIIKKILQAQLDYHTAYKQYNGSKRFVVFALEAFKQIEQKYDIGKSNFIDFHTSILTLNKAKSQLLIYKYECLFKRKIMEYYILQQYNK